MIRKVGSKWDISKQKNEIDNLLEVFECTEKRFTLLVELEINER